LRSIISVSSRLSFAYDAQQFLPKQTINILKNALGLGNEETLSVTLSSRSKPSCGEFPPSEKSGIKTKNNYKLDNLREGWYGGV